MKKASRGIVSGVFDLLHPGHQYYLEEASKLTEELYVIVAHDTTAMKLKGRMPLWGQQKRMAALQKAFPHIHILAGNENPEIVIRQVLSEIQPDLSIIGHDQIPHPKIVEAGIGIHRLPALEPEIYASRILRTKKARAHKILDTRRG